MIHSLKNPSFQAFFSLKGTTTRRTFNVVLLLATLPFLCVLVGQTLPLITQIQNAQGDATQLLRMLETSGQEKSINWLLFFSTSGIAYLLLPLFVRRLRDCLQPIWWIGVIYTSITLSALSTLFSLNIPSILTVPLGLATLYMTFKMSLLPSSAQPDAPAEEKPSKTPFLASFKRKPYVDLATFVPKDGDDERAALDDPDKR